MNKRLVFRIQGTILLTLAASMLPSLLISLGYGGEDALPLLISMLITAAAGLPLRLLTKPRNTNLHPREGFVTVALAWLFMSLFGCLPFLFSGFLPTFSDAFFEACSGFSTTGSTVVTDFSHMPRGITFWRSFTHWIGGMGVLVLTLAVLPQVTGRSSYLVKAESPGPSLSKVAPKIKDSSKILYVVYTIITLIMFIILLLCGLNPYDAGIHALGTAGTGGFSNHGASIAAFHSPAVEIVMTVFMFIFGSNLSLYFLIFNGRWRDALRSEELRWYFGIDAAAFVLISIIILPGYHGDVGTALRQAAFNVATITSTSGFVVNDYTLWPVAARAVILILMFIGASVGSTAGGMKTMRIVLLLKQGKRDIHRAFSPRRVSVIRFEGRGVDENMLHQTAVFAFVYLLLVLLGGLLVSLDGLYDIETNFSAALTCLSNVGPGFGAVGPTGNFAAYSPFAKTVLSLLMLAGRLELYPILILFHPKAWRSA